MGIFHGSVKCNYFCPRGALSLNFYACRVYYAIKDWKDISAGCYGSRLSELLKSLCRWNLNSRIAAFKSEGNLVMKIKVTKGKKCLFWHRWRLAKDMGANQYFMCKDCDTRFFRSSAIGYQPVDLDWLFSKTTEIK